MVTLLGMQHTNNMKYSKIIAITSFIILGLVSCKDVTAERKMDDTIGEAPVKKTITVIDNTDLEQALATDDIQLIDVRTQREWDNGHLAKAKHFEMNNANWEMQLETLDKDKPVYVYCEKGGRSARCAKQLEEAGFTEIYDLKGGMSQWKSQGKPIVE